MHTPDHSRGRASRVRFAADIVANDERSTPVAVRFLADESCDYAVVRALRDAEHDVVAVAGHRRS